MGKKISFEDAEKLGLANDNDSVYAKPNKYGYKININHPKIRPLYERFKRNKKAIILSDRERFEFEIMILHFIQKGRIKT